MAKVVEESFGSPNPQSKATAISETDNTVFDFVDPKRSKASAFEFLSGHFCDVFACFRSVQILLLEVVRTSPGFGQYQPVGLPNDNLPEFKI